MKGLFNNLYFFDPNDVVYFLPSNHLIKRMLTDLKKIKEEIDDCVDIEEIHKILKGLSTTESKIIVESFTNGKTYANVSLRHFQEDYIADYLEYLWEISEESFWKHVKSIPSFTKGLLWSSNMFYIERMINCPIPDNVWKMVLKFALHRNENQQQDLNAIGCVIKSQANRFGRKKEIFDEIAKMSLHIQKRSTERINKMLNDSCNYSFGE